MNINIDLPSQAIYTQKNPNMPPEWPLGFGNCILPYADTLYKIHRLKLDFPLISPYFNSSKSLKIFEWGAKYLCLNEGSNFEDLKRHYDTIIHVQPGLNSEDYLELFKKHSSLLIVEPFTTHDDFDYANWRRAGRFGAIYNEFDLANDEQMQIVNQCTALNENISIEPFSFEEEDSKKIQLFLRFGRYAGDTETWVRKEYPGKLFSDHEIGFPSGTISKNEDPRMPLSLLVNTLQRLIEEDRTTEVRICSDFLNASSNQRGQIAKWFKNQFDKKAKIHFSFPESRSMWEDLFGGQEKINIMIGGSSDFVRVAAAKAVGCSKSAFEKLFLPKPDLAQNREFIVPDLNEMQIYFKNKVQTAENIVYRVDY